MTSSFRIGEIIYKTLQGGDDEEERALLEAWLSESEEHRRLFDACRQEGYWEERQAEHRLFEVEKGYRRFLTRKARLERRRSIKRWSAVAAGVCLAAGIAWTVWSREETVEEKTPLAVQQIAPGRSVATLTLADGRQIVLGDSLPTKVKEASAEIHIQGHELNYSTQATAEAPVYNRVSTPRGGEYQLVLGDGTRVSLNAQSELRYPVTFGGKTREVQLVGEAYFEVAPDAEHPFIVKTDGMNIRVLGTSFNVCAYREGQTQATLVEGKVKVWTGKQEHVLAPGQQLCKDKNGQVDIREVDVSNYTAWRNKRFVFEDEALEEVLYKLERWYNVTFFIQNEAARELRFTGDLPKYENLDKVLKKLELVTYIRFVQGKDVILVRQEK